MSKPWHSSKSKCSPLFKSSLEKKSKNWEFSGMEQVQKKTTKTFASCVKAIHTLAGCAVSSNEGLGTYPPCFFVNADASWRQQLPVALGSPTPSANQRSQHSAGGRVALRLLQFYKNKCRLFLLCNTGTKEYVFSQKELACMLFLRQMLQSCFPLKLRLSPS